jgi:hypothetical protein
LTLLSIILYISIRHYTHYATQSLKIDPQICYVNIALWIKMGYTELIGSDTMGIKKEEEKKKWWLHIIRQFRQNIRLYI